MSSLPYSGRRVICANKKSKWYGRIGTITNFNSKSAGVAFDDDPAPPPTGHWCRKEHLVDPDAASGDLLESFRKNSEIRSLLIKARESAILAVDVYNKPGTTFRTPAYLVLMTIGWTSALLAHFRSKGVEPYYRLAGGGFEMMDGHPKSWSPIDCVKKAFPNSASAVRQNLEFVIGLRNHIEHAHCPALDSRVFGHCQALLSNFDQFMAETFGSSHTIGSDFALALQPTTNHTDDQLAALRRLFGHRLAPMLDYVDKFDQDLPDEVYRDPRYRYRVLLVPVVAPNDRNADAAVRFVNWDPNSREAVEALAQLQVLVKPKEVPVASPDDMLPGDLCREVQSRLPGFRFGHSAEHPRAVKYFKIHSQDEARPELCDSRYCVWHRPSRRYTYHRAWVEKLVQELSDASRWETIIGWPPKPPR